MDVHSELFRADSGHSASLFGTPSLGIEKPSGSSVSHIRYVYKIPLQWEVCVVCNVKALAEIFPPFLQFRRSLPYQSSRVIEC